MGQALRFFQAAITSSRSSEGEGILSVQSPKTFILDGHDNGDQAAEIRRTLARELHDRVAQTLTTMLVEMETFKIEQTGRQSALRQLDELQVSTREVLSNLRMVLYDLRSDDDDIGDTFTEAVRSMLTAFREKSQLMVNLSVAPSWPTRLRPAAAMNLYRIIEQALANVQMHSGAGLVEVALGPAQGAKLAVEIRDDGRGGAPDGSTSRPGLGVIGMHERATLLGGKLEVESADGRGTTIRAILPKEQLT